MKRVHMPNLERIHLHTNGLLWTRADLGIDPGGDPGGSWSRPTISIDAATPETYAINRRGGDFRRLLGAAGFISELRIRRGRSSTLGINMTVQANNYREMPAFVELGRRHHCDRVSFHQLLDWGSYPPEEYDARAIQRPTHPEHEALLEMLADKRLEHPIVYLSNLTDLSRRPSRLDRRQPSAQRSEAARSGPDGARAAMRLLASSPGGSELFRNALARGVVDLRSVAGTTEYTRFVIVGIARTGSTMLINLLNAHGCKVRAFGELFREPDAIGWDVRPYRDYQSPRLLRLYNEDPCRIPRHQSLGRWPRGQGAVGFKIFYYHAREARQSAVWSYLARNDRIRVIHIRRRNILAQFLSLKLAHATNVWSSTGAPRHDAVPVRLEVEDCRRHFEWVRSLEAEADALFSGHRKLDMDYEDSAADHEREMSAVQRFLGVPEQELEAGTRRQRTAPLDAAIANYAELQAAFADTPWSGFFAGSAA